MRRWRTALRTAVAVGLAPALFGCSDSSTGTEDPGPLPVDQQITETVAVLDSVVLDVGPAPLGVSATELISVSDSVIVELGPAPVYLTVTENIAVSDSVVIDVASGSLEATITAPTDSAAFLPGDSVTFEGSGSDPEDGTLTGSSLAWDSDIDGPLGTGTSVTTTLTLGTHAITLTATDSDGNADTAAVSVIVADTALLFMSDRGPSTNEFDLFRVLADGSTSSMTPFAGDDGPGEWSPDGTRIVFETRRCISTPCIWNMAVDGSDTIEVTLGDGTYYDRDPAWSPDATRIAFTREPSSNLGTNALYTVNADGTDFQNLTGTSSDWDSRPDWAPTGTRIVFRSSRNDTAGLFLINPDGSALTRLTSGADNQPTWSPDGTLIAFTRWDTIDGVASNNIHTMSPNGGDAQRHTESPANDGAPAWSSDGTRIYFVSDRDGNAEIYVVNADGTGVARVTRNSAIDAAPHARP